MNPPIGVFIQVDPQATEAAIAGFAVGYLRDRGYSVTAPREHWEKFGDFMRRLGLRKTETVHRALRAWEERGQQNFLRRGRTGRIIEILSTPAFDDFCRRNKSSLPSLP